MGFQPVEYSFPHEEEKKVEVEGSSAIEIDLSGKSKVVEQKTEESEVNDKELDIEVVDDTPKADRNRKASTPPEEVTDEELEDYSEKVRKRIQHFSKGYHDERRAKEAGSPRTPRTRNFAKTLVDENNKLKGSVEKNQDSLTRAS